MNINPSTWAAAVLLVAAASAASFFASQWKLLAKGQGSWAWIATGTGVALLLSAAITLLAIVWELDFKIPFADDENAQKRLSFPPAQHSSAARSAHELRNFDDGERSTHITARQLSNSDPAEHSSYRESQADSDNTARTQEHSALYAISAHSDANEGVLFSSTAREPWSATRCVVAFQIDPADETRWIIENGCTTAVGIVVASCELSADQCATSATWRYRLSGLLLPAKWQRPVTQDESTQVGRRIRFVACNVTTAEGARLIGSDPEMSATRESSDRFQGAIQNDDCLSKVHQWSEAGRRSSRSPDALFGGRIPVNGHERN